jgi:hypothetical protein
MKLLPFGDSHTYFWGRQKSYSGSSLDDEVPTMAWLGPAKAHGLTNDTNNKTFEKFNHIRPILSQPNVTPIACFGEIDIRVNCARNFLFTGLEDVVNNTVDSYLATISAISNNRIYIWGPPPSAPDDGMFNTEFPAYGDNQTRNYLTHVFNRRVLENLNNFPNLSFITLFYDLVDSNLITNSGVLHDGCHMEVEMQPLAKQAIMRSISDKTKATLNLLKFQQVSKYKRIFKKIDKLDSSPYINFYKVPMSITPEYFSYSPNEKYLSDTLVAAIQQTQS